MRGCLTSRSMPPSIAHHVPGCPAFVPGIRLCGHGRSLTGRSRDAISSTVFVAKSAEPGNRYYSCFRRPRPGKVRAFGDRHPGHSCFWRPEFVLLATGIRAFGDQSSCFRRPIGKASDRLIRGPNSNPDQALGRSGLGVILTRPAPAFRRERPFTVEVGVSTKSNVKPGMVLSSAMRFNSYRKCLSEL